MSRTIVIHHSADFDGIFCREIARKFLPDAELIGWNYGDPIIPFPPEGTVYVLDLSPDCLSDLTVEVVNDGRLIWIDHHKSSIDKYSKYNPQLPGYRIDGVAACRLAWQYFSKTSRHPKTFALPDKQAFIDRTVSEPLAVRLAGEYDIWDKRDPNAELFQHGLRSQPFGANLWRWMLGTDCDSSMMTGSVEVLLKQGEVIQFVQTEQNASIIKSYGFDVEFEGLKFLACNHARFNSFLFTAGLKPEHEALLGFNWDGPKREWRVSLYHAPGKEHHDLSQIAVKYGGGGHRGACGFRIKTLPFLT